MPPSLPAETHCLHHEQPDPHCTSPPGGWQSLAGPPGAAGSPARLPRPPAGAGLGKNVGRDPRPTAHWVQRPNTTLPQRTHQASNVEPPRGNPCSYPRCCRDALVGESRVSHHWQTPGRQRPPCQPHQCEEPPRDGPNSPGHARTIVPFPLPCSCCGRAANLCVL